MSRPSRPRAEHVAVALAFQRGGLGWGTCRLPTVGGTPLDGQGFPPGGGLSPGTSRTPPEGGTPMQLLGFHEGGGARLTGRAC